MRRKIFNPYKLKRLVGRKIKNSDSFAYVKSAENIGISKASDLKINPYLEKRANNRDKIKIAIIALSTFGCFAIYAFHPIFKIKNIQVSGLKRIDKAEFVETIKSILNYKVFFIMPAGNYPFVNLAEIKGISISKYPIDTISIKKIFPSSLNIEVREKEPAIIYTDGKKISYLDNKGYLIENLRAFGDGDLSTPNPRAGNEAQNIVLMLNIKKIKQEFGDLPIFYYQGNDNVVASTNKHILDSNKIASLLSWFLLIGKQLGSSDFYMAFNGSKNATMLKAPDSKILIGLDLNEGEQLTRLQTLLSQKDFRKNNFSYIDLRYPDRIYWQ